VAKVIDAARNGRRCATTALAVHGVITGARDRAHRYRLNTFDLVTPDGQPVRWGLNLLYGTKLDDRVYGPTMMLKVCKEAAWHGIPIYFYGSSQKVLDRLSTRLPGVCPNLKIAGVQASEYRKAVGGRAKTCRG
jgi:N-acetylglucosaminyldiphosphoundecaprenol N-acetyl-beta-D-mannosaminyltransferase